MTGTAEAVPFPVLRLLILGPSPRLQIDGAHGDAENVGGDKSELGGLNADNADDDAINCCQRPAFPATATNEDGRSDGQ
jgi:hypothetical protein